jgi:hypothetical protein
MSTKYRGTWSIRHHCLCLYRNHQTLERGCHDLKEQIVNCLYEQVRSRPNLLPLPNCIIYHEQECTSVIKALGQQQWTLELHRLMKFDGEHICGPLIVRHEIRSCPRPEHSYNRKVQQRIRFAAATGELEYLLTLCFCLTLGSIARPRSDVDDVEHWYPSARREASTTRSNPTPQYLVIKTLDTACEAMRILLLESQRIVRIIEH